MQGTNGMAMDRAYATAERLIAFWTRPRTLDPGSRQLCGQLAEVVDPAGALADAVRDDPDGMVARLAAAVRASERNGRVLAILGQFTHHSTLARSHHPRPPAELEPSGEEPTSGCDSRADRRMVAASTAEPAGRAAVQDRRVVERETGPVPAYAILLAASDPTDLARLRLGQEEREIREALDLSSGRGRWAIHSRPALRLRDLTRALLDLQPRIVHFAGHGSDKGGLFLENEAGLAQCVPTEALADLFRLVEGAVDCVVLNACFSRKQARAISAYVPFVVGSPSTIEDQAAVAFSVGFYQTLGAGRDISQAYSMGRVHMRGAGTARRALPMLIKRSGDLEHGEPHVANAP
jgi:hypothetical protein